MFTQTVDALDQTVCFTGHRPPRLCRTDAALVAAIDRAIEQAIADGYRVFLCGMALGADTAFAERCLVFRRRDPSLRLVAVLPCADQDARWGETDRARYRELVAAADTVVTICESYEPYCMNARNRYMVENSRRVIAAWDGSNGGTAYTVRLAEEYGRELVRLSWD